MKTDSHAFTLCRQNDVHVLIPCGVKLGAFSGNSAQASLIVNGILSVVVVALVKSASDVGVAHRMMRWEKRDFTRFSKRLRVSCTNIAQLTVSIRSAYTKIATHDSGCDANDRNSLSALARPTALDGVEKTVQ